MSDYYVDSVTSFYKNTEFQDYIVLLEKQSPINLVSPIPIIQKQIVIYIDVNKNIYVAKLTELGRFSTVNKIASFSLTNIDNETYIFNCDEINLNKKCNVIRLGNQNQFATKEDFIDFLQTKNVK